MVALIDDPQVRRRRAAVADLLGPLIDPSAPTDPHVTAWVSGGNPPLGVPNGERVELLVGGAALFRSAAYLAVHSPGLLQVREGLAARNPAEDRTVPFTPHLTVGVFRERVRVDRVRRTLEPLADLPPLPVTGVIRHMVVDVRSDDGALRPPPDERGAAR